MTSLEQRAAIKKAYPGNTWSSKVDRMSDNQVHVIFLRLKSQKRI